ncbi:substrate-binding domain-containing protein [Chitinivorax sp. B]|uniref:substrate-binding domain-containing protein n=1 Tax=Chitinivorax sp. B TaxID=2502235 RepID=UPI002016D34D|nr:substrate-binding domain-containing protein [Chitinivorax sp. B]
MRWRNKVMMMVLTGLLACGVQADPPQPLRSLGISVSSLSNPFFVAIVKAAEAKARKINPGVRIMASGSNYDQATQDAQLVNFIKQKVSMILLVAVNPAAVEAMIKEAKAAGIVVVAVDVDAFGADAVVQTDNRQAGRIACEHIATTLKGQGNVIIQSGPIGPSSVVERVAGCHEVLKTNPNLVVLSDNEDGKASRWGGRVLMQAHLARYPRIDAVFTINDQQAIGADISAREKGRTELMIVSVDGAPDVEDALRSGSSLIRATASQNPHLMAEKAIEIGYGLLNGHAPAQRMILLPSQLVTRDNLHQYRGWTSQ